MYFAPNFETEPTFTNDVIAEALPGEGGRALVLDLSQWLGEMRVQGVFEDSTGLPPDHRQALLDLDSWTEPITAEQQVGKLLKDVVFDPVGPPYYLYTDGWEFTAESAAEVDPTNGVLPAVAVTEIRAPEDSGNTRNDYLVRFQIGFED